MNETLDTSSLVATKAVGVAIYNIATQYALQTLTGAALWGDRNSNYFRAARSLPVALCVSPRPPLIIFSSFHRDRWIVVAYLSCSIVFHL